MALPRLHSCTWSDDEPSEGRRPEVQGSAVAGPERLKDKELHLWVTYPDKNCGEKKNAKRGKRRHKVPRLWAVVILEDVSQTGDFTYEVALRRIFKSGERTIRVSVTNDPADQSDDAKVFGFVSPRPRDLVPLEEYLIHVAAKRLYDAITEIWGRTDAEAARCSPRPYNNQEIPDAAIPHLVGHAAAYSVGTPGPFEPIPERGQASRDGVSYRNSCVLARSQSPFQDGL